MGHGAFWVDGIVAATMPWPGFTYPSAVVATDCSRSQPACGAHYAQAAEEPNSRRLLVGPANNRPGWRLRVRRAALGGLRAGPLAAGPAADLCSPGSLLPSPLHQCLRATLALSLRPVSVSVRCALLMPRHLTTCLTALHWCTCTAPALYADALLRGLGTAMIGTRLAPGRHCMPPQTRRTCSKPCADCSFGGRSLPPSTHRLPAWPRSALSGRTVLCLSVRRRGVG